jgi:hypothetical protein
MSVYFTDNHYVGAEPDLLSASNPTRARWGWVCGVWITVRRAIVGCDVIVL